MPHANRQSLKVQQSSFQNSFRKHTSNTDCHSIFNLLTSPELFDQLESLLPAHRERLFPPTETLAMFVAQVLSQDRSCQNIVNQAVVKSLVKGLTPCSTHTGGYCKARQRLPLEMPKELARFVSKSLEEKTPSLWRWHGRRVRLVDGTTVTMPDSEDNQNMYPQEVNQKPGIGFPITRLLAVTDLYSGAVLDLASGRYQGKGNDEQSLLRSLSDMFESGDIILRDAFFPSYLFIAEMLEKGVDILMEQYGARRRPTDLSFKHCLQLWLNYLRQTATLNRVMLELLLTLMSTQRVGKRPGRVEPRAVKRKPKPYPKMLVPRAAARENIRKNGHPKKLK